MNQIEEDTTTDDEISEPVERQKSEFVRPAYSFKGMELFPFTYGYELIFNQVRDAEDTGLFTWFAFIYLLRKRNPSETKEDHKLWACKLAWRVETFRTDLIQWMDENGPFSVDDKLEAKRIYEESMKAVADSTVEPVPIRGKQAQKKTSRQRKPQSSISSDENLGAPEMKSFGT